MKASILYGKSCSHTIRGGYICCKTLPPSYTVWNRKHVCNLGVQVANYKDCGIGMSYRPANNSMWIDPEEDVIHVHLLDVRHKSPKRTQLHSLRKQLTYCDATTGFPAKRRLRNGRKNSRLMTRHYPDLGSASDWLKIFFNQSEALRRSG